VMPPSASAPRTRREAAKACLLKSSIRAGARS
jgi:hypothetical protein